MMELSEKKTKIIDALERLLMERGSKPISVRDIAAAANINVAMISYYFGSKDEAIETAIKYRYTRVGEVFMEEYQEIEKEENIVKKLNLVLDLYVNKFFTLKHLDNLIEENKILAAKCRKEVVFFHFILVKIFNEIIQEGMKQGIFKPKADIDMLVGSLIGTMVFFVKGRIFVREFILKGIPESKHNEVLIEKIGTHLKTMIYLMLEN